MTPDEFIEVYPMLPGHIHLLLQITTALRTHSSRAQGDDQAIRGLLQLLGELFRDQKLADQEVGALVTLDQIYEVQQTALESDIQQSMARILDECRKGQPLLVRAAKAVALLELIQETVPTDAKLVAQSLYDRVDRGNHQGEVKAALEELRLTPSALEAVAEAAAVRDGQLAQLRAIAPISGLESTLEEVAQRVEQQLAGARPWRGIDLEELREAYRGERRNRIRWQEDELERARLQVRSRKGFSTLSAETTEVATSPPLAALRDPFLLALQRAVAEAHERLDEISSGGPQLVTTVELGLANRELTSEADLEALLDEIRKRLSEHLEQDHRIRIL